MKMRSTATHVFFWGGIFSNWSSGPRFSGRIALAELLPRLAALGVRHPAEAEEITRVLVGHAYPCGEQWMMAAKAWIFGDLVRLKLILEATAPADQKSLGRDVSPFDPAVWDLVCVPVVTSGCIARCTVNPSLRAQVLATENRVVVEGSPKDRVWGVGLRWDDPKIEDQRNWRGRNLLGISWVDARRVVAERYPADAVTPMPRRRFTR
jgi:ribA/ribD-fused uncharacterized protein